MSDPGEPPFLEYLDQQARATPLVAFSYYLSGRIDGLLRMGDEIVEELDRFQKSTTDGDVDLLALARAEFLLWLWILGAYEMVRTMCQAKDCFSERVADELTPLKKRFENARIPAAKLERPREKRREERPVESRRNPAAWDEDSDDLVVGSPDAPWNWRPRARQLIDSFRRFVESIERDDVLKPHERSKAYERRRS